MSIRSSSHSRRTSSGVPRCSRSFAGSNSTAHSLASLLRPAQRLIGSGSQAIEGRSVLRQVCDADRGPERRPLDRRRRQLVDHEVRELPRVTAVFQHDRELVAAEPRRKRPGRRSPPEHLSRLHEGAITRGVPVVLVGVPKPVEVDPEESQRRRRGRCDSRQPVVEGAAVGKPRQRISQALELRSFERLRIPPRDDESAGRDGDGAQHHRNHGCSRVDADGSSRREQRRQLDRTRAGRARQPPPSTESQRATSGEAAPPFRPTRRTATIPAVAASARPFARTTGRHQKRAERATTTSPASASAGRGNEFQSRTTHATPHTLVANRTPASQGKAPAPLVQAELRMSLTSAPTAFS